MAVLHAKGRLSNCLKPVREAASTREASVKVFDEIQSHKHNFQAEEEAARKVPASNESIFASMFPEAEQSPKMPEAVVRLHRGSFDWLKLHGSNEPFEAILLGSEHRSMGWRATSIILQDAPVAADLVDQAKKSGLTVVGHVRCGGPVAEMSENDLKLLYKHNLFLPDFVLIRVGYPELKPTGEARCWVWGDGAPAERRVGLLSRRLANEEFEVISAKMHARNKTVEVQAVIAGKVARSRKGPAPALPQESVMMRFDLPLVPGGDHGFWLALLYIRYQDEWGSVERRPNGEAKFAKRVAIELEEAQALRVTWASRLQALGDPDTARLLEESPNMTRELLHTAASKIGLRFRVTSPETDVEVGHASGTPAGHLKLTNGSWGVLWPCQFGEICLRQHVPHLDSIPQPSQPEQPQQEQPESDELQQEQSQQEQPQPDQPQQEQLQQEQPQPDQPQQEQPQQEQPQQPQPEQQPEEAEPKEATLDMVMGCQRILAVAEPYQSYILSGAKCWELRSSAYHFRGRVALWHRKQVGGLATLTNCLEVAKRSASGEWGPVAGLEDHFPFLPENFRRRMVAEDSLERLTANWKAIFAWVLTDSVRFTTKLAVSIKRGCQSLMVVDLPFWRTVFRGQPAEDDEELPNHQQQDEAEGNTEPDSMSLFSFTAGMADKVLEGNVDLIFQSQATKTLGEFCILVEQLGNLVLGTVELRKCYELNRIENSKNPKSLHYFQERFACEALGAVLHKKLADGKSIFAWELGSPVRWQKPMQWQPRSEATRRI